MPFNHFQMIGDGHSDWMTEKVDLSSFVSTTSSSPRSSLPPSPPEQDVKVPSDLEVMTSLLQEELAQLEDYFRSESTSAPNTKLEKPSRCDKAAQSAGAQSSQYYQLPYGPYGGPAEPGPVVVSLASGELDLAGFCGGGVGPVGRTKIARPAPYNYHHHHHRYHHHHHQHNNNNNNNNHHHHHHHGGRRIASEAAKVGEDAGLDAWGPRGSYSGGAELSHYSTLKPAAGKAGAGCGGGAKRPRESAAALKEEESYCFSEGMFCSEEIARGFCLGAGSYDHKRADGPAMQNQKGGGGVSYEAAGLEPIPQETMAAGDGYFHHHHHHHHQAMAAGAEPYHSFIGDLDPPPQAQAVEPQHGHYLYPECLADQSYECLSRGEGELMGGPIHRPTQRLKDEPCGAAKPPPPPPLLLLGGAGPQEPVTGERKQKKRDQNKTAAHRYRLRKRAELDCLEEELHGLEGQNRELRDKAESVEREIQYVKDLLIEVYKARSQRLKQDA
ncbi:uncharacterized protein atf5b isoform X2 [Clinocottus analis]|uniref:uncharacterized protein atf5b isoform X2 n=1 Tax=Clinocottus analis TaxID=304258 RepID=UPI0035C0AA61